MNRSARRPYRLGLDLGSNSLGWFMVWLDDEGRPAALGPGGVRIYSDGRDPQSKASNAVERRVARGARRRRDRYLQRREKLMMLLVEYGLMPADKAARKELEKFDPYELRARALDEPLTAHHLGRALFHLDQRRGFLSNRKTEKEEDNKLTERIGELKRSIRESNVRTLGEYLWLRRLSRKAVRARPEVGFYPDRELYEDEFDKIRSAQTTHQSLSSENWGQLRETIFFQRDLKPVEAGWCLLEDGEHRAPRALPCAQEFRMVQEIINLRIDSPGRQRTLLSPEQRKFVLDHLRSRKDIRLEALQKLLVKRMGLEPSSKLNLLDDNRLMLKGDETAVRLSHKDLFGKAWHEKRFDERTKIIRRLIETTPEEIEHIAQMEWGFDASRAKRLATTPLPEGYARLSEKAISKLLPKMEVDGLSYAEAVAAIPEYGHHSDFRTDKALEYLPYYGSILTRYVFGADATKPKDDEIGHYGRLANPTVHIGLNQLRRVVNLLVKTYGKPEEIIVELARDLKMNREERDQERKRNKENESANKNREQQIRSAGLIPSPYLVRKLRLWEEQSYGIVRVCPFTGAPISLDMALRDDTEIEHLLPFSKTLDDSMANKVLCLRAVNRVKRDGAPFKAFQSNPFVGKHQCVYDDILLRADSLPPNKRWRFHPDAMERFADESHFLDRQLNETRYLSRLARTYLAHLYNEKSEGRLRVRVIPGKLTAMLRGKWGLSALLRDHNRVGSDAGDASARKNRNDHRHHAVDAFVVAMTDQRLLTQISALNSDESRKRLIDAVPDPWPDFSHEQMRETLNKLVVSHKVDHGIGGKLRHPAASTGLRARSKSSPTSGKLHDDTAYGAIKSPTEEHESNLRYLMRKGTLQHTRPKTKEAPANLVYRKMFLSLNMNEIGRIRDIRLRELVREHVELKRASSALELKAALQAFAERTDIPGLPHGIRHVRLVETKESEYMVPVRRTSGEIYKSYFGGENAFVEIFETPDGKWHGEAVSIFKANQGNMHVEWRKKWPSAHLIMRVFKGDSIALDFNGQRTAMVVRQLDAAAGRFKLAAHNEGGPLQDRHESKKPEYKNDPFRWLMASYSTLKTMKAERVRVDELGRLWRVRPHDASRPPA